jgi:glutamate-1-semialdehyde 2,1-aminomutase
LPGSKGQNLAAISTTLVRPWNDVELLQRAFEEYGESLAAVIMEPMMCNTHAIAPLPGYLEEARRLCDEYGVVLIFDEVITGFRLGLSGAQGRFGVTPDLALFGKAMAAGFPIGCLAGARRLMKSIASGEVVHAGTFNSNLMAVAAADATTDALYQDAGQAYETMNGNGESLMQGIREIGDKLDVSLLVEGFPTAFAVAFTDRPAILDYREYAQFCDHQRYKDFALALFERGVNVASRGIWYLSTAHSAADIEATLVAVEDALSITKN